MTPSDDDKDEIVLHQIKLELVKNFKNYRNTIRIMSFDLPISVLNLPKSIEKLLYNQGFHRVYDFFDCDFTKIEGLSASRIRDLTSRVNEFLSII